jgi:hypothetical protein
VTTNAGVSGVGIEAYHNSSSPSVGDLPFQFKAYANNSVGTEYLGALFEPIIINNTDGSEEMAWRYRVKDGGGKKVTFQTGLNDSYFDTNLGIGTNSPAAKLDVNGDALISSIDIGKGNNELSDNTVFGVLAGTAITTGNYNTFIGKNTGIANTTGEKNTFFGRQAGYSNITGSNNVFIGHQAGYNETGSDKLYIDNSSTSTPLIGGDFSTNTLTITGDIEYTGTLTDVSDRRLKKDIEPLKNSLEKILKINPVSFKMKADEKGRTQLGVIAQNVKEHFPQVVSIIDPVNGFLGVDYTQLIAPLIGAMKAQQAQIEQLQKDIKKLKKRK